MTSRTFAFTGGRGEALHAVEHAPPGPPVAVFAFHHGYGEHSGRTEAGEWSKGEVERVGGCMPGVGRAGRLGGAPHRPRCGAGAACSAGRTGSIGHGRGCCLDAFWCGVLARRPPRPGAQGPRAVPIMQPTPPTPSNTRPAWADLANAGVLVRTYDCVNHGRSVTAEADKGLVPSFQWLVRRSLWVEGRAKVGARRPQGHQQRFTPPTYPPNPPLAAQVDDFTAFAADAAGAAPGAPLFVGGHSMGGLVATLTAVAWPGPFPDAPALAGLILCSAAVNIEWTPILRIQAPLGGLLAALAPRARIVPAVNPEHMSSDPELVGWGCGVPGGVPSLSSPAPLRPPLPAPCPHPVSGAGLPGRPPELRGQGAGPHGQRVAESVPRGRGRRAEAHPAPPRHPRRRRPPGLPSRRAGPGCWGLQQRRVDRRGEHLLPVLLVLPFLRSSFCHPPFPPNPCFLSSRAATTSCLPAPSGPMRCGRSGSGCWTMLRAHVGGRGGPRCEGNGSRRPCVVWCD